MSLDSALKNKIRYLYSVIDYDKKSIQDIKSDLRNSSFKTQCILYGKINEYREDIEDTIQLIKNLMSNETCPNDESRPDKINPSIPNESSQAFQAVEVYDQNGNQISKKDLPSDVQNVIDHITKGGLKRIKDSNSVPATIDFKTFLQLYGSLVMLNETNNIGVLEKGGKDFIPKMMDLIDMNDGTTVAQNITSFEQLLKALNMYKNNPSS